MKLKYKITFGIATVLALISWAIAIYYWDKLPPVIPIHFGFSGAADGWAEKSIFQVFLVPFIQSLILALFVFIYHKPQYSNIPSTIWLAMLDEKTKDKAYGLIRTMHSGILVVISVLFTYIAYSMNEAALGHITGVSTIFIFTIIGLMIAWAIFWTIKIYQSTKETPERGKKHNHKL